MRSVITFMAIIGVWAISTAAAQADSENLKHVISKAASMEANLTEDGVVRLGWQRKEVPVEISGMKLEPPAGLGSWAAFKAIEDGAIVMGDTVVFQDEITPALDTALANELKITALHNHFIFDNPPVYFMHIAGAGDPARLAAGVRNMWDAIKAVREKEPKPQQRFPGPVPKQGSLNADALASVLGTEGTVKDGVVKFSFGREGQMAGVSIGASMGLSTWAAFSGSQDLAAVDGDFIMTADEVQPVLHALRDHDINVVALHNHMIGETPKFYFLHYWGTGSAKLSLRACERLGTPRPMPLRDEE